jgi:parallel beta-helix repeat protein
MPKSGDVLDGGHQAAILDGNNKAHNAVYGDATTPGPSNVTVEGFVIQNFSTPAQRGAVQDYNGPGWLIRDNYITNNAAAGVATGDAVRVLGNRINHNGQEAFSAHGNGGLYKGNEMAYNNFNLAYDATSEAGGGKAWQTTNLTFNGNYVHDNGGYGLWADTSNLNTRFENNTVSNNWGGGIYEEVSYNAAIINNTVIGNGMPSSPGGGQHLGYGFDAGIQVRLSGSLKPSSPLLIYHNTVINNFNGITLLQVPSTGCRNTALGEGAYGRCSVKNVRVVDNGITMSQGTTGAFQDGAGAGIFTTQNNTFQDNHYCVALAAHPSDGYTFNWFAWADGWPGFSRWQGYGLDTHGTFTVGGICHPS